ncbi:uncharacterized protein CMU_010710 [Cryptosporidium muris RN66]|uniref:Uncharacterized protein n=1 Tax=Cryptosporidium muris (strain RN66) TaxID=441375 RepID=B6AIT2_CRYMR|nr:uncharacterized protein CMU_010710 [Cryptosporidium muris RN66]EEA08123.1 hypothetical protein CMU_010710 [Cryptosporidium muris RN66]|eukprot:XP_002142472.1 hypothetical protein [Cryptosporidium muris RN66]
MALEIYYNQIIQWLLARRYLPKDWELLLCDIDRKLIEVLKIEPETKEVATTIYIKSTKKKFGYLEAKAYLNLLVNSEEGRKRSYFGDYSSRLINGIQKVLILYEEHNLFLAQWSKEINYLIKFRIPSLERTLLEKIRRLSQIRKKILEVKSVLKSTISTFWSSAEKYGLSRSDFKMESNRTIDNEDEFNDIPYEYLIEVIQKGVKNYIEANLRDLLCQLCQCCNKLVKNYSIHKTYRMLKENAIPQNSGYKLKDIEILPTILSVINNISHDSVLKEYDAASKYHYRCRLDRKLLNNNTEFVDYNDISPTSLILDELLLGMSPEEYLLAKCLLNDSQFIHCLLLELHECSAFIKQAERNVNGIQCMYNSYTSDCKDLQNCYSLVQHLIKLLTSNSTRELIDYWYDPCKANRLYSDVLVSIFHQTHSLLLQRDSLYMKQNSLSEQIKTLKDNINYIKKKELLNYISLLQENLKDLFNTNIIIIGAR